MLLSPERLNRCLRACISGDLAPHTALLLVPQGEVIASVTEGTDEEPWLEEPERSRLLSGLASQWHGDEHPRVECELGRLYMMAVPLAPAETASPVAALPTVRDAPSTGLTLVLNGNATTPWTTLASAAETFLSKWLDASSL